MYTSPYSINYSQRKEQAHPNTDSLFIERWSPRSFKKTEIPQEIRDTLFDAARWSPSAFNEQPWRIFVSNSDDDFERFLSLVAEQNQVWVKDASILGFMIAKNHSSHNNELNPWAIYDCGFFWASFTFQARKLGLFTHALAGIKHEEVYKEFDIPKDKYTVIAGFAIGEIDTPDKVPEDIQKREAPTPRKDLSEIYFPGGTVLS